MEIVTVKLAGYGRTTDGAVLGGTSISYGTIYFCVETAAWYSDEACQAQISTVPVPYMECHAFAGYRSGSTVYVDASGAIAFTPSWTSSRTATLYAHWTHISDKYTFDTTVGSSSYAWTPRTAQFYRSVADGTRFYSDDQLANEITSVLLPFRSGYSCAGAYNVSNGVYSYMVHADGTPDPSISVGWNKNTDSRTLSGYVRMLACYKMTLDANGGAGGPASPVWWDRVRGKWCSDDTMLRQVAKLAALPTKSGAIFAGYYTSASGGTQVVAADGTLGEYAALASSNKTVYAQWATPVTITADHGSGTGTFTALYYGGGRFFDSSALTNAITSVNVPTLANYKFLGYYSAASGGTQYIDAGGNILAAFAPTSACTVYAQYERVSYTITVSQDGGGGVEALYANPAKTAVYDNIGCTGTALPSITPLTKAGHRFMGLYSANSISGTQLVTDAGAFTSAFAAFLASMGDSATIYAIWQQVFTITLDRQGGEGAPSEIYYDDTYCQFYDDAAMSTPVSSIEKPSKECCTFAGFYDAESGGALRIGADGAIGEGWAPAESITLYARWDWKSYRYALDPDGGATAQPAIYNDGASGSFYADDQLTVAASSVALPERPGYSFAGYYDGEACVVAADGSVAASSAMSADATATARWTANAYTLTFDYDGGAGGVASKPVTFGEPVGDLPTAARARASFSGWTVGGEALTASTAWKWPRDAAAVASWELDFGGVNDWFGLALATPGLAAVKSGSGDARPRVRVSHGGRFEKEVSEAGGVWRSPSVTYQVYADTTLSVTLGKAYAATMSGKAMAVSGYMITSVEVQTQLGAFPTVVVRAAANEGADAINRWTVRIPVKARARAQNLMGAVTGGGELQSLRLAASCSPVVLEENLMPCASDVVDGKVEVEATLCALNNEGAPAASGGFASVGEPKECGSTDYAVWSLSAEKEL